jgi:IS5 family transposase
MRSTQKGKTWHFGMKVHVGTDKQGLVHTITTTDAAEHDSTQFRNLLHGEERELYGDSAYWKNADRDEFQSAGIRYRINKRGHRHAPLTGLWRYINRTRSKVRARGEHAFNVVKNHWGFDKVRYRGLAKNTARAYAAFALANLYLIRQKLVHAEV